MAGPSSNALKATTMHCPSPGLHCKAAISIAWLVCECLSATKGERGRGRIDSIARSQKGTSASGQGGPP